MVNIGIVGIGFMGTTHFKAAREARDVRVAAICTRDRRKLDGDWRHIRGNFGEGGGIQDLSGVKKYTELDQLLADPEIDLVDICLPTHLHPETAIRALEAGKHVLVEKPIALTLADADAMIDAARRSGRRLFVGQVLRFFPEFAFIKEAVASGRYGRLLGAHFKRIISRPNWGGDDWFNDPRRTGGPVIDLHIHDADFVQYLLGMPSRVFATGLTAPDGQVYYVVASYLYDGQTEPVAVTAQSGAVAMPGRPFEHGYDVYLEKATLLYNSAAGGPVTLLGEDGGIHQPEIAAVDAFTAEIQYVADSIAGKETGELLAAESARRSLLLCHKVAESVRRGEPVPVSA